MVLQILQGRAHCISVPRRLRQNPHLCTRVWMCLYICVCMYECTHVYDVDIHVSIHTCMHRHVRACIHTYTHTYIHTYIFTTDRPPATNAITDTTPFRRCAATGDRHTRHKSTHNTHRFADALRQGIVTHEHAQVRGFEGESSLPVACCRIRPSSQQLLQRPVARLCACMSCRRVCVCIIHI